MLYRWLKKLRAKKQDRWHPGFEGLGAIVDDSTAVVSYDDIKKASRFGVIKIPVTSPTEVPASPSDVIFDTPHAKIDLDDPTNKELAMSAIKNKLRS